MGHKKKAPKKAAKKSSTQATSELSPQAAYEHFLADARALGSVHVSRIPPAVAAENVKRAWKDLAPYAPKARTIAPSVDVALVSTLPAIARAFQYAASRVPDERSDGSIDAAMAAVAPIRAAALAYLDAAAFCGLVDGGRVRSIHQGKGKLDVASDAVAIAGVFSEYKAELEDKHPFEQDHFDTLATRGAWLVDRLKPSGAVRDKKKRNAEAHLKDQFGALLERAYAEAEKLGAQVWGVGGLRAHVPPLQSQAHAKVEKGKGPPGAAGSPT